MIHCCSYRFVWIVSVVGKRKRNSNETNVKLSQWNNYFCNDCDDGDDCSHRSWDICAILIVIYSQHNVGLYHVDDSRMGGVGVGVGVGLVSMMKMGIAYSN